MRRQFGDGWVAAVVDPSGDGSSSPGRGRRWLRVLGGQLGQARAVEQEHQRRGHGPSPLAGVAYPNDALSLWRWVPAPADEAVGAVIAASMSTGEWARVQASLTMDDLYTVMAFARRRALLALRTGDWRYVVQGLNALALVDLQRIDRRDLHSAVALVCFAGQRLQAPMDEMARSAAAHAQPPVADLLTGHSERDQVAGSGYHEITSPTGTVLLQRDSRPFAPRTDLIGPALRLVDIIEQDRYRVDDVTVATEIPHVWLAPGAAGDANRRVTGCVTVRARPHPQDTTAPAHPMMQPILLLWLAEAANPADAAAITADSPVGARTARLGIAVGHRVALLIARSVVQNAPAPEDAHSLTRFHTKIAALLNA